MLRWRQLMSGDIIRKTVLPDIVCTLIITIDNSVSLDFPRSFRLHFRSQFIASVNLSRKLMNMTNSFKKQHS